MLRWLAAEAVDDARVHRRYDHVKIEITADEISRLFAVKARVFASPGGGKLIARADGDITVPDHVFSQLENVLGIWEAPVVPRFKMNGSNKAKAVEAFVNAAVERTKIKRNPFHPFSSFDTATLGALAYGQTVLARIAEVAGMAWDEGQAHSAIYDAEQTAEIFCRIVNQWDSLREANPPAV